MRTDIDFSKHEYHHHTYACDGQGPINTFTLKLPDSRYHMVEFICASGITAVTGDYGNWIFNREFHPGDGGVSDEYWKGKMSGDSGQTGDEFDQDATEIEIRRLLSKKYQKGELGRDWSEEEREYLEGCLEEVYNSGEGYRTYAYENVTGHFDFENIPYVENTKYWLKAVFDAFDEMCNRLKLEDQ